MTKSISQADLETRLSQLSPEAEGLFYFLPDECWMKEATMAAALQVNNRVIRRAKRELEAAGLVRIIPEPNRGGRPNPKHRIVKVIPGGLHPIPPEYDWVAEAREKIISPLPEQKEDSFAAPRKEWPVTLNWKLLKQHSPAELNRMPKLELIELYMEIGFLVLPTHYPLFNPAGEVSCSCKDRKCSWPGKHPAVRSYKALTPATYPKLRGRYLKRFKNEPNLNVGFKVFGFSVLDVDFQHGGSCSLGILREECPGLDDTLSVASPNGEHLYSSSTGLRQSASVLGRGLDIRSDATSGFVVAPCSVHSSGRHYRWKVINDPQPMPQEWVERCEPARTESAGRSSNIRRDKLLPDQSYPGYLIPLHERNDTLYRWACRMRGRGAGQAQIYKHLQALRDQHCEKGERRQDDVSDDELRTIARKACRYPTNAEKLRLSKAA